MSALEAESPNPDVLAEAHTHMTIRDVSFCDATDVYGITIRLHPLDVGWDIRCHGCAVSLPPTGVVRVSYASRDGERRVVEGPSDDVAAHLRYHGYDVRSE